jgi:sugar lactone lactonase YvrE
MKSSEFSFSRFGVRFIVVIVIIGGIGIGIVGTVQSSTPTVADVAFFSDFLKGSVFRVDLSDPLLLAYPVANGLKNPEDGVCGPDGKIYFADSAADTIIRFRSDGSEREIVMNGKVHSPEGPSFDSNGDLFFTTRGNEAGQRYFTHTGVYRIKKGDPANAPESVIPAFTQFAEGTVFLSKGPFAGDILVVDEMNNKVVRSSPPSFGKVVDFITTSLASPRGIALDSSGDVFVSNNETGTVIRFDPDGTPKGTYTSGFNSPWHLEFDSADNLFLMTNGGLYKITPGGDKSVIASGTGFGVGVAICRR